MPPLAVVAVVVLHAPRRSREIAFLRTLGLTDRQALALLVVEQGLPVLLALAIGVAPRHRAGLVAGAGHRPGGLQRSDVTGALQVDWGSLAAVAGLVAVVVVAAVALSSWLARRLDVGQVLRIGEQ